MQSLVLAFIFLMRFYISVTLSKYYHMTSGVLTYRWYISYIIIIIIIIIIIVPAVVKIPGVKNKS